MDPDRAVCGERQGDSQRSRSQSAEQCDEDVEESQKRPPALVCRSGSQGMGSAKRGSGLGDFPLAVGAREVREPAGSEPCGHVHRRVDSQLQTGLDAPSTSTGGGGVRHDWPDAGDRLRLCQSSQGSSGSAHSQRESQAGGRAVPVQGRRGGHLAGSQMHARADGQPERKGGHSHAVHERQDGSTTDQMLMDFCSQ